MLVASAPPPDPRSLTNWNAKALPIAAAARTPINASSHAPLVGRASVLRTSSAIAR